MSPHMDTNTFHGLTDPREYTLNPSAKAEFHSGHGNVYNKPVPIQEHT